MGNLDTDLEDPGKKELMDELQRLLACYQIASRDDKNVVWAAMNKYVPHIQEI